MVAAGVSTELSDAPVVATGAPVLANVAEVVAVPATPSMSQAMGSGQAIACCGTTMAKGMTRFWLRFGEGTGEPARLPMYPHVSFEVQYCTTWAHILGA